MSNIFNIYKQAFKDSFVRPAATTKPDDKPRIQHVDLAKGFCIILVVIFHSDLKDDMPAVLNLLRMPLYFVLSGLFFKDYGGFFNLTERKINKILIPALFFYTLLFVFYKFSEHLGVMEEKGGQYFSFIFNEITYGTALWFLFSLFFCNLIFCIIYRMAAGKALPVFIGCAICSLGGCLLSAAQTRLILYIDTSLSMMPFFFLGWWLRNLSILYPGPKDTLLFWLSIGSVVILCLVEGYLRPYGIDFLNNIVPGVRVIISFVMGAVMVISSLLILKKVVWLHFVSYIGRYSIIVLLTHSPVVAFSKAFFGVEHKVLAVVVTLIVCWFAIPLVKEYLPHVSAQKDWFKLPFREKLGIS